MDVHELARPQPFVLVRELSLQLNRAGVLIDLIVDEEKLALGKLFFVLLIEGEHRDRAVQHRLAHRAEIALRQREDHGARLDLREHRERIDVIGVDDVADIDLTEADHAVDRRRNGGVIELGLRRLDGGLIGVDRRLCRVDFGLLGIDVLQRLGVPQHQRLEPRQVLLGVDQLRLVLALLGYGLIERGLEWRRIDFRQHVAFADVLALTEIDRDDLAVDLGADARRC